MASYLTAIFDMVNSTSFLQFVGFGTGFVTSFNKESLPDFPLSTLLLASLAGATTAIISHGISFLVPENIRCIIPILLLFGCGGYLGNSNKRRPNVSGNDIMLVWAFFIMFLAFVAQYGILLVPIYMIYNSK
jgi:hypothetical protein